MSRLRRIAPLAAILAAAAGLAACSSGGGSSTSSASPAPITTVRLGYFPNLTHAPALIGVQQGTFKAALKDLKVSVTPTVFNAGPDAVTALFADSLDCTYIGPNPAVNAYVQSKGAAIRVVAGAASGGASLVVRTDIDGVEDMKGKSFASPQLGNTQDVAFRSWLKTQGVETTPEGGGDVSIKPQSNAEGLAAFGSGEIAGAWVPEPWVSEYVAQGAKILVDESSLWPEGKFVTTHIVCRTAFIAEHPDAVTGILKGHIAALDLIEEEPAAAKESITLALSALTGSAPKPEILDAAWQRVTFTEDPLKETLVKSAEEAITVGLLEKSGVDAAGGLPGSLYDLALLNAVLTASGKQPIK